SIEAVKEDDGFLHYQLKGEWIPEAALADTIGFSSPLDRLMGRQLDDPHLLQVRNEALHWESKLRKAPNRGFTGGRIDLIEHQLYIAQEVTSRLQPRVLLADEVGLGKTIEACLILHRLHLTGRAERTLIILPESLMHQWFIELMRRFNLLASLFDEERCQAIESSAPETNPFLDSQIICVSLDYLTRSPERYAQVLDTDWDLLVVDEAHHLEWTPEIASPAYQMVEGLSEKIPSVLLLTATPQQLGAEGHFARLRLLDPVRYNDLDRFVQESDQYQEMAELVDRIEGKEELTDSEWGMIEKTVPHLHAQYSGKSSLTSTDRGQLTENIIDSFGPGRVMFRNTRKVLGGFPQRRPVLHPLDPPAEETPSFDQKIQWLISWLTENENEKILLICKTRSLVEEIYEAVQEHINLNLSQFHEGLNLIQRDRQAAYFADPEGARVLLCSEIGSEGRNFQFAHHLILWDLPENPELLEQRIGRLDRIGQTETIHIHLPYVPNSAEEVWVRFYDQGLGIFHQPVPTALILAHTYGEALEKLANAFDEDGLRSLVSEITEARKTLGEKLENGYLRLLARNSCKPGRSQALTEQIQACDVDPAFETFATNLMEYVDLRIEDLGDRRYLFKPEYGHVDSLPGLDPQGMMATFDRTDALNRDDIHFFTPDHPLLRSALDSLLGSEKGNTALSVYQGAEAPGIFLQVTYLAECVAPRSLHVDRYLPITPITLWMDHNGEVVSAPDLSAGKVNQTPDTDQILGNSGIKRLIKRMVKSAERKMFELIQDIAEEAGIAVEQELQSEISRLQNLARLNPAVDQTEIKNLQSHQVAIEEALTESRYRLDSLHLLVVES
ncbi:MAG: DEAD/DEAH box helicase family protein, partial [Opitutae bacterium]|nr:DEAD/DEAH box helicase family protein [Opitutae bacterium]